MTAGMHTFTWNGLDDAGLEVESGLYLCRLSAGDLESTVKMVYTR